MTIALLIVAAAAFLMLLAALGRIGDALERVADSAERQEHPAAELYRIGRDQ